MYKYDPKSYILNVGINMKKFRFILSIIPLFSFSCGSNNDEFKPPISTKEYNHNVYLDDVGEVSIHSDLQNMYLEDDYENIGNYAKGNKELSRPVAINLSRGYGQTTEQYEVKLSEYEDMYESEYFYTVEDNIDIINLKVHTDYYWTVRPIEEELESKVGHFKTDEKGIRNLYISGVTNARDIGGVEVNGGGTLKQGNIYRMANADSITEKGKAEIKRLGIKTEIDLRDDSTLKKSPAGAENFYLYNMFYDDYSNYIERNCEAVKGAIKVFANEDNYPIYYHCKIGTDRTGYMTYLLMGLCGAKEEDIYRDYLFSNFGNIEGERTLHGSGVNDVRLYYDAINAFPGKTLQHRIYNFLISIGVKPKELQEIIRINVEDLDESIIDDLENQQALFIDAENFDLGYGLELENYYGLWHVKLTEKENKSIFARFFAENNGNFAIYTYMYSKNLNTYASDAYALYINDIQQDVTDTTFKNLHCRATTGIYVAGRIATCHLDKGENVITLKNIANENNKKAYGAYIGGIVIIPLEVNFVSL